MNVYSVANPHSLTRLRPQINSMAKTYIFHRGDYWYLLELKDDQDAIKNAEGNVGTTKVTDIFKKIIWEPKKKQKP